MNLLLVCAVPASIATLLPAYFVKRGLATGLAASTTPLRLILIPSFYAALDGDQHSSEICTTLAADARISGH